jgi:hydroxyethylthiazole kinase-like uncharacterized protein yjeF
MIELLTTAEMAEADRLATAGGVSGETLMENAGRAVADVTAAQTGRRVMVVAGPGNNGGDGFVVARLLAERGYAVRIALVGDRARIRGEAARAAARWRGPVEQATPASLDGCDIIVDALFGAGLDRDVGGLARTMIEAMNAAAAPTVAVDLPSGVNGTTGAIMGVAVNAARTVTFFRRKTGHVLLPGRFHCGPTSIAQIGIPPSVLESIKPRTFINEPRLWAAAFPMPRVEGHKYTRGHAVVVSGGQSTTGAARLAARAALRAGAGLVSIASPRDALAVNAATSLAVMVRPVDGATELTAFLADKRRNAVVLGPGLGVGVSARNQVAAALDSGAAVVLDADALTSFAGDLPSLVALMEKRRGRPTVLTPHNGEFSCLFSCLNKKSDVKNKLQDARLAADEAHVILLLKGPDTVVATADGRASIAENAPPTLATAGSGDVLAGLITSLLAQGMSAFEAASAAVWLHGEAANLFGPGLIAEDLSEALPAVYRRLYRALGRT